MIPEPKPRYLSVIFPQPVSVKCLVQFGTSVEYVDMVLFPGQHTLAMQVDENGSILAPWPVNNMAGANK